MENYKELSVNSHLDNFGKVVVENALFKYLQTRIFEDDELLEDFAGDQIEEIITQMIERYGDEINHFVAVALEKVAESFEK